MASGYVTDLAMVSTESFLVIGLLVNPPSLVMWQVRKLQAIWSMALPTAFPNYATVVFCEAPGRPQRELCAGLEDVSVRTPALPADNSAWNTICEGTCDDLREMGYLVLSDPCITVENGLGASSAKVEIASQVVQRLYITGGAHQPGQVHLMDLRETVALQTNTAFPACSPGVRRSVAASQDCIVSVSHDGTIYASNGASMSSAHIPIEASAEKGEFNACCVCIEATSPFIVRYAHGGNVDVFYATNQPHQSPPPPPPPPSSSSSSSSSTSY